MKRFIFPAAVFLAAVLLAVLSRPGSLGVSLEKASIRYAEALSSGNGEHALEMMTPDLASGLSPGFLSGLQGLPVPGSFVFSGSDENGIRMTGSTEERGSRVLWFSSGEDLLVARDTAVDNLLGSAVMLCRASALSNPRGVCPVSGAPYEFNESTGMVVCVEGHLGDGLYAGSDNCAMRRDSVAAEVRAFLEAGYSLPDSLENIFTTSSGEFGRRGGYRCPDNGYKYYEIREGMVYCPFHLESTAIAVEE